MGTVPPFLPGKDGKEAGLYLLPHCFTSSYSRFPTELLLPVFDKTMTKFEVKWLPPSVKWFLYEASLGSLLEVMRDLIHVHY